MTRATMPSMSEMMELNRATSYLDPSNAPYTPEKGGHEFEPLDWR